MNVYLTPKLSALTDAVVSLTQAMLNKHRPFDHRVMIVRHTHNSRSLVELRVINPRTTTGSNDYGVRQAWIYADHEEAVIEVHYTTQDDINKIVDQYPSMKNVPSIVFATQSKQGGKYSLSGIYQLCEELIAFLSLPVEAVAEPPLPSIEEGLPEREA